MMPSNCWEVMKCGREHGGTMSGEMGECVASSSVKANGLHNGLNGGRVCWALAGTFCGGKPSGTFAAKMESCEHCSFYKMVRVGESGDFKSVSDIKYFCGK